ncbi:MAG: fibrobacter succinogenes major paralogous domain-containing protein [Bacteroidales bacterium]|nr:fibrobacter succinogenes major paralogous domain-containing protein [Bacteroidales bacterium]
MKRIKLLFVAITLIASCTLTAQVSINTDDSDPDASAMLDVKSTEKGMLVPRMTQTEIAVITSPANGLIVFNTTDDKFYAFISADSEWKEIAYGTGTFTLWNCGDPFVDTRDSKSYSTVEIGTQCWMAENLNIGTMINGSNNQSQQTPEVIEKYCYNDNMANCDEYGGLYQWDEAMEYVTTPGVQGICPDTWHLPTDAEWCILEQFVDPTITCSSGGWRGVDGGGKLKEAGTTHWQSPNAGATNSSGFTGLPGGVRFYTSGSFSTLTINGIWWSSSESGSDAWSRWLGCTYVQVARNNFNKNFGFSVRCLRDN